MTLPGARISIPTLLLISLSLGGLFGCSRSPQGGGEATEGAGVKRTVAVIPKATTHSYWKAAEAGARKAAADLGVEIEWQGPLDDSKVADQIGIFNNLAASGVAGILLAPCDDKALLPHVRNARKRGLPVVIFDSPLSGKAGEDYLGFIATDNRAGGEIAGRELIQRMGDRPGHGGKVLMLRFTEGSASTRLREEGFSAAIAAQPALKIVSEQFTDGSMAGAQRVAETLLHGFVKDNRLELDGIFASNQPTAEGMTNALRALRDKGVVMQVRFVGFDDSDLLAQGLANGIVDALVVQDPQRMGDLGVRALVDAIEGKPVAPIVDTGVTVRTRDGGVRP